MATVHGQAVGHGQNSTQSSGQAWGQASQIIGKTVATTLKGLEKEVGQRTYRASNQLRNASIFVLRGTRNGRVYLVPGTKQHYKASAPGESPANRTGIFRNSWGTHVHVEKNGVHFRAVAAIESKERAGGHLLGEMLENGAGKMKPRPYKQKVIDRALPKIKEIYKKPF